MNYQALEKIRKAYEFNRMDQLIQLSKAHVEEFRSSKVIKECYDSGEFEKIEKLLDAGAWDVNTQDSEGKTLAHYAASNSDFGYIANALNPRGVDLNIQDKTGSSPLHHAAVKDAFFSDNEDIGKVVADYVKMGAAVDMKNRRGETVIDVYNRIRPNHNLGDDYGI